MSNTMSNTPSQIYSEEYLLDRLYSTIGENGIKGKIVMPKIISNIENKKTYISNYLDIENKLKRDYIISLMDFIKAELSTEVSVSADYKLVITHIFRPASLEKVIKNYISNYVQCKSCNSGDTFTSKENKIIFINCNKCKSKKAL